MPQCNLAIKDTVTGLWLKVYSPSFQNCQFGAAHDALCMDGNPNTQDIINDLNQQSGADGRFVGQNPPPR